ncbi:lipase [Marinobacter szutsaonensis]
MFKKTLISLAVASSVGLTGCWSSGDEGANANPDYQITDTTIDNTLVRPIFDPVLTSPTFDIPANFDLVLLLGAGQSTNYDFTGFSTGTDPASASVSDLAGYSTSGQINIRMNGSVNPETVIANQTVHLVPLNMKPVSAATPDIELTANPSYIDTENPFDLEKLGAQRIRAEVVSLDGGSDNVIRITPLEPLADQTKYLVLVTDGVKGADGRPTEQSVPYSQIAGDGPLGNPAFQSIRDVLNAAINLSDAWLGANGIDQDVTLAYTMTTSNTKTVFNAITAPGTYLGTLGQQVVLYSALQVVKDNLPEDATASTVFAALADALSASPSNTELAQKVGAAVAPYSQDETLGPQVVGSIVSDLPFPKPRTTAVYDSTIKSAATLPAISNSGNDALIGAAQLVNVSEGAIELPYYQKLPGTDGTPLITGMWRGDTQVEAGLNATIDVFKETYSSLSNFSFPRDSDGTFNLTQYMPFPEENAKVAVPVTIYYPNVAAVSAATGNTLDCSSATGSGITDVVIFQHGITVDRSVATIPAINLTAQSISQGKCIATIAIDQPLHGLSGSTVGTIPGLTPADQYIDPADFPDADYVGERHFYYSTPEGAFSPQQESAITDVRSGSLFINLTSMQTTRDNLRQGVMDLLNLSATIANGSLDIDGSNTNYGQNQLHTKNVHFVGHSLGGITGSVFASMLENPTLRGTNSATGTLFYPELASISLMNTGGQLTKLVENSPSLAPPVLGGLAAAGVSQGTSTLEAFLYVLQSTIDNVDPVNYGKNLGAFATANGTGILVSEVVGDLTVPNEANVAPLDQALSAPLAGTEPLMALIDIGAGGGVLNDGTGTNLISASNPVPVGSPANAASFYFGQNPCVNANHGTFVAPAAPANEVCPEGSNTSAAFADMIGEVIGNVTQQAIPVTNPAVLGDSMTVEFALDQN